MRHDAGEQTLPTMIEPGILEIRTTFPSRAAAVACADGLVRARLAACVQVDGPIASTYLWQGAVQTAAEWRCSCKTTVEFRDACLAAISRGHPYETPELLVVEAAASPAYAAWLRASLGSTSSSSEGDG